MKVLFLHGWKSTPGGVKPTYLRENGFDVLNPSLDNDDFAEALQVAQSEYERHQPDVIVGSSRGGAVAMNLRGANAHLVLLCPAWKKWGAATRVPPGTFLLHSRFDEVIPFEDSEQLARASSAILIEVGSDHRLADRESLEVLRWACSVLVSGEQLPTCDDDLLSSMLAAKDRGATLSNEASYFCDSCGEEIVIPFDLTEGSFQTYIEDCPVCCRPNVIHIQIDDEGNPAVHSEPEQDRD
jgi:hypothetical protein